MIMRYQQTSFMLSAAKLEQCPADEGIEVAFAGRSNAGKSSVLNALCQSKQLARTSKTPGRTQLLNFFRIQSEQHRLVDLPGYGYAKVANSVRRQWEKMLEDYLCRRQSLVGIVLIMDIRHPLKPYDEQMLAFAESYQLPVHVLLNKADKLSRNQQQTVLKSVQKALAHSTIYSVQVFSALSKLGVAEVYAKLNDWFEGADEQA